MTEPAEKPLQNGRKDDPTENVRELVGAENRRQDDLRAAEARLRDAEYRHSNEVGSLRAFFYEELRKAEAQRIDAIRAVDVGNVQRAAEVQAVQASTLAAQVATSAETLRTQVAAAASAASIALAAALEPVQKDIADLRRAQYEAQGQKTQVVETQARGGGVGLWVGVAISFSVLVVSTMAVAVTIAITLTR